MRPLYDDGSANPSRGDARLRAQGRPRSTAQAAAPLLSIFGGKITTYRCLAEEALAKLAPFFPGLKGAWTATEALPGGDVARTSTRFRDEMQRALSASLGRELVEGIVRRHGSRAAARARRCAQRMDDLGDALRRRPHRARGRVPARPRNGRATAEDVLWRRTKCGLHMSAAERARGGALRDGPREPMTPLAEFPLAARARDPRRAHRHRRHAHARTARCRRGLRRARAPARARACW